MERFAIKIEKVSKKLGPNAALDGISMVFKEGSLNGIIGCDGAGKTTLIRTVMGLLKPDSGEIIYLKDSNPFPFYEVRPRIAYMPASQSLYPDLSVSEHLEFFRKLYGLSDGDFKTKRKELLKITRLEKFQSRKAGHLSGGMYKKLGLMCSLLPSPSILLLDEPTNGVDPISRREFWTLLYKLLEKKILIILSTAYMDEAERCSFVNLMDKGKLLISGEPGDILKKEKAKNFEEFFLKGYAGIK